MPACLKNTLTKNGNKKAPVNEACVLALVNGGSSGFSMHLVSDQQHTNYKFNKKNTSVHKMCPRCIHMLTGTELHSTPSDEAGVDWLYPLPSLLPG